MRRLMLLRHAEAGLNPGGTDIDRVLTPAGRNAAKRVGQYLKEENLLADLVLVSSAKRALETWEQAKSALGQTETRSDPSIYNAAPEALLEILNDIEHPARTLLVIGHNPGIEELAKVLVGSGDRYALARLTERFPAGGLAVIDFAVDEWSEVAPGKGRLDRFVEAQIL